MNTGKQINAMVVVVFLLLLAAGAYTVWDPFRSDRAKDDQILEAAERAATTFSLNCRLCHGDRGQGGVLGGRLPAALSLNTGRLQGISEGTFNLALFEDSFRLVTNTVTCGRVGTAMPVWGATQGGPLNEEQIRQLAVLITEGRFWGLAQEHADELDAEATNHASVRMPGGVFGASETELVVSNAGPYSVDQFIRIRTGEEDEERLQITDIPSTGQRLVESTGKTPDEFLVSGSAGIEVGAIIRLDGELVEVLAVRNDGDRGIELAEDVSTSAGNISVSDPAFFAEGYVLRVDDELIRVDGAVKTGQLLGERIGRAETSFAASGTTGIQLGLVIRIERELLLVIEMESALLTLDRGVDDTAAVSHGSGTAILEVLDEADAEEAEDPDTGQTLIEALNASGSSVTVSGTSGIIVGETYQLGEELVRIADVEPARLRVERGVGDTSRAEHSRRSPIFEGNLLDVERGFDGTTTGAHGAGAQVLFTEIEVRRAAGDSELESHSKNAQIYLGNRLIVERGVSGTEAAEHPNGELVLDFPQAPDGPAILMRSCGQIAAAAPPSGETPSGPAPTPVEGAEQVAVSLGEFEVIPEPSSIADGPVTFQISNDGTIVHNLRVIATDLPPDGLPLDASGFQVDEEQVDVVSSSANFGAGEAGTAIANLAPGSYVLICNIPTHYEAGMWVAFEVTAP